MKLKDRIAARLEETAGETKYTFVGVVYDHKRRKQVKIRKSKDGKSETMTVSVGYARKLQQSGKMPIPQGKLEAASSKEVAGIDQQKVTKIESAIKAYFRKVGQVAPKLTTLVDSEKDGESDIIDISFKGSIQIDGVAMTNLLKEIKKHVSGPVHLEADLNKLRFLVWY